MSVLRIREKEIEAKSEKLKRFKLSINRVYCAEPCHTINPVNEYNRKRNHTWTFI